MRRRRSDRFASKRERRRRSASDPHPDTVLAGGRSRRSRGPRFPRSQLAALVSVFVGVVALIAFAGNTGPDRPTRAESGRSPRPDTTSDRSPEALRRAAWPPAGDDCVLRAGRYVDRGRNGRRLVALTFDDGPSSFTARVLSILRSHGIHGTFFLYGREIKTREKLVRRELDEGHEIANHTFHHANLTALSERGRRTEFRDAESEISQATGGFKPCLFRAPYGLVNPAVMATARREGLAGISWDVDSVDYLRSPAPVIARRVLNAVRPGSIILLHDGGGDRAGTVAALPRIIAGLKRKKLEPVTVSRLLKRQPKPRPASPPATGTLSVPTR